MAEHSDDIFHHVRDSYVIEVPGFLGREIHIPQPFGDSFRVSKFMMLEVVAAIIVFFIFRTLAVKISSGAPVRGLFWNFWEMIALALRDSVVRPTIGTGHAHHDDHAGHDHGAAGHAAPAHGNQGHGSHGHVTHPEYDTDYARAPVPPTGHPADKYVPFVWSVFFFVLLCNLLGAIPWMGSPTGSLWVTGVIAFSILCFSIGVGMHEVGHVEYWGSLVPSMDLPPLIRMGLVPLIWLIEFIGLFIKHGVLAIRLFANIMAGHTVISAMLGFIALAAGSWVYFLVLPASILGQVAIGLLELFVAFLQAYILAFLTALFIGTAVHPH